MIETELKKRRDGIVAAAKGIDAHRNQAQTNGHHHRTSDNRGEELAQGFQEEAQHGFKQAANDGGPHDGPVGHHPAAHGGGHGIEDPNKAGGGTHDDGHLAAHGPDGKQLHQGHNARHQHGILQKMELQLCKLPTGNAADAGNDQQRGQIAHKHGENVLQAQRDGVLQRHFCLKLIGSALQFRTL